MKASYANAQTKRARVAFESRADASQNNSHPAASFELRKICASCIDLAVRLDTSNDVLLAFELASNHYGISECCVLADSLIKAIETHGASPDALKSASILGVVSGAGSDDALAFMDQVGAKLWGTLPFTFFQSLVKYESQQSEATEITKGLVVALDKYLWSQNRIMLPAQLWALMQCENAINENPSSAVRKQIYARLPRGARRYIEDVKSGQGNDNPAVSLPSFYAEDPTHWGVCVAATKIHQNEAAAPHANGAGGYIMCEATGCLLEGNAPVSVFPCGHIVGSRFAAFNVCPVCPCV